MKKVSLLLLLFIVLLLSSCTTYKALKSDETIDLASNYTKSIVFLINENGYSVSTKFIVKTKIGDQYYLKEGIKYKEDFSFYQISECDDIKLVNDLNNCIYYANASGIQGLTYVDGDINDIPYNYKTDGFGDLMLYYGTNNIITLFKNETNFIEGINNQDIVYIANLTEKIKNNEEDYTDVLKKTICLYQENDTLYIYKEVNTIRTYKKSGVVEEVHEQKIATLMTNISIKKGFVIDYLDTSKSVILDNNNVIYVIDNNTLEVKTNDQFNNILTFNKADRYFYVINNNNVFIYDAQNQLYQFIEYTKPVIGSSWFSASNLQSIRIATLEENASIRIHEINLPVLSGPEPLI